MKLSISLKFVTVAQYFSTLRGSESLPPSYGAPRKTTQQALPVQQHSYQVVKGGGAYIRDGDLTLGQWHPSWYITGLQTNVGAVFMRTLLAVNTLFIPLIHHMSSNTQ